MKIVEVRRADIVGTARKLAAELGGKMYSLKGFFPLTGKSRGIVILPSYVRGEQGNLHLAIAIIQER